MGYRSSGYLIFPEHFLPFYEASCPGTSLEEYEDVSTMDGYVCLHFTGWKWYGSYSDIQEIEGFMSQLDEWMWEQESMEDRLDHHQIDEAPEWCIYTKEVSGDGTINMFKPIDYVKEDWLFGFNLQGEEAEDYNTQGEASECGLFQTRGVDNPWGYEYGGWAYSIGFKGDVSEEGAKKWASQFEKKVMDNTSVTSYDTEIIKWWNDKFVFRISGSEMSDCIEPIDDSNLAKGWKESDGTHIDESDELDYDMLDPDQVAGDYAFAIWNTEEVTSSNGDYYDMEIYEYASANWEGFFPTSLEPDFRGAYK